MPALAQQAAATLEEIEVADAAGLPPNAPAEAVGPQAAALLARPKNLAQASPVGLICPRPCRAGRAGPA